MPSKSPKQARLMAAAAHDPKFPHLRDSIRVERAAVVQGRESGGQFTSGAAVEVRIIVVGPDFPYAAAVHENPSLHDPPTWRGRDVHFTVGGPKFLERPLMASFGGLQTKMRKVIS